MANDYRGGGRSYGWDDQARVGGRHGSSEYGQRGRTPYRDRNANRDEDQQRGYYSFEEDRIGGDQDYEHRSGPGYQGGYGLQDRDYRGARRSEEGRPPGGYQWERDGRGERARQERGYGSPRGYYGYPAGMMSGFAGSRAYGSDFGRGEDMNYGQGWGEDRDDHGRNWWDKTTDEVQSWFGDDDAARRRRTDEQRSHRGRGPEGYTRSDERVRDDVHDKLTDDWLLDASRITVSVENGEVTLSGFVDHRRDKRRAEDLVEDVSGVRHVQNNIRVEQGRAQEGSREALAGASRADAATTASAGSGRTARTGT